MGIKEELLKNIRDFFSSAELVFRSGDYTSATILYFKTLFVVIDYIILTSGRDKPKDHTERFRILERYFRSLYFTIDKIFYIYRNTYTTSISKENCKKVRGIAIEFKEKYKIKYGC